MTENTQQHATISNKRLEDGNYIAIPPSTK